MPLFKYLGGDQRPDIFGTLEPGDVLVLGVKPEWGNWEATGDDPVRQSTPQPVAVQDEPPAEAPAAQPVVKIEKEG